MKKTASLILAFIMAFLLVGCNLVAEDKAEITRGKIDGDTYINDFLDLKFTKPDSWIYSTDEEIAATFGMSAELLGYDNFKQTVEDNISVYDMMVKDSFSGTNINIFYENLVKQNASNITIEQYVEAIEKQLENVSAMTVTFPEKLDTVKLGENEFTKVVCSTEMNGMSFQQVYYLKKVDGYMCGMIATIVSEYSIEDIEAMFE